MRKQTTHTFLSAAAANGAGTALDVSGIDNLYVFVGAPSSTLTVKARGTLSDTDLSAANWAAAGSVTNPHDGLELQSVETTATVVAGDTGIALAAAAHAKMYRVNLSGLGLSFVNFVVSGFTGGSVTVTAIGVSNNR